MITSERLGLQIATYFASEAGFLGAFKDGELISFNGGFNTHSLATYILIFLTKEKQLRESDLHDSDNKGAVNSSTKEY